MDRLQQQLDAIADLVGGGRIDALRNVDLRVGHRAERVTAPGVEASAELQAVTLATPVRGPARAGSRACRASLTRTCGTHPRPRFGSGMRPVTRCERHGSGRSRVPRRSLYCYTGIPVNT